MIETGNIQEFESNSFSLMLPPCSALVLPYVLSETVPFVWLQEHRPHNVIEWWSAHVPLRKDGPYHHLRVRNLRFDLLLPTQEFLTLLPEFAEAGMLLLQLERVMPNTLEPQYLKKEARYSILRRNGWYLEFDLPHQGEFAWIASPHREVLERIREHPIIASGDLP